MAEEKWLFFFDIDGTLRREDDGAIPESTVSALRTLRERGHLVFINTGRTKSNVGEDVRSLGFDGYVYGCGTEVELHGETVFRQEPDRRAAAELAEKIYGCDVSPVYERSDVIYTDRRARKFGMTDWLFGFIQQSGTPFMDITEGGEDFSFDKFCIMYDEKSDLDGFKKLIEGKYTFVDRGFGFAEMIPTGCSKASGIQKLMEITGVPREHTAAFGDSMNDLAMIEYAGLGVVMGGAENMYPYADYVTKPLMEGGIAFALSERGFI